MISQTYRIAIVGATTLKGKELADALGESVFGGANFALFDEADAIGRLEAVGDEVTLVRAIEDDSFSGMDFVFFAGKLAEAKAHAAAATAAGATIIDLTGGLESLPGAVLQSPWLESNATQVRLDTPAVVIANPAAGALALLAERLGKLARVEFYAATVLEPASEQGREAMDELHQQTVKLLSFQPLPKDIYDAQTAFNMLTEMGAESAISLLENESRIAHQYATLSAGKLPEIVLQLAHAPVFHGYIVAAFFRLDAPASLGAVKAALSGAHTDVVAEEAPSNIAAAGLEELLVRVRTASGADDALGRDFRLWMAVDNLRLNVIHATEVATELRGLRPLGQIQ